MLDRTRHASQCSCASRSRVFRDCSVYRIIVCRASCVSLLARSAPRPRAPRSSGGEGGGEYCSEQAPRAILTHAVHTPRRQDRVRQRSHALCVNMHATRHPLERAAAPLDAGLHLGADPVDRAAESTEQPLPAQLTMGATAPRRRATRSARMRFLASRRRGEDARGAAAPGASRIARLAAQGVRAGAGLGAPRARAHHAAACCSLNSSSTPRRRVGGSCRRLCARAASCEARNGSPEAAVRYTARAERFEQL